MHDLELLLGGFPKHVLTEKLWSSSMGRIIPWIIPWIIPYIVENKSHL
jgi:hypothetical protein